MNTCPFCSTQLNEDTSCPRCIQPGGPSWAINLFVESNSLYLRNVCMLIHGHIARGMPLPDVVTGLYMAALLDGIHLALQHPSLAERFRRVVDMPNTNSTQQVIDRFVKRVRALGGEGGLEV